MVLGVAKVVFAVFMVLVVLPYCVLAPTIRAYKSLLISRRLHLIFKDWLLLIMIPLLGFLVFISIVIILQFLGVY